MRVRVRVRIRVRVRVRVLAVLVQEVGVVEQVGTQLAVVDDAEQVCRYEVDGGRVVGGGGLLLTAQPRGEGRRLQ